MSEFAEGSGKPPNPDSAGGGEGQDSPSSKSDSSRGLPAYHVDPVTQSRPSTPAEYARAEGSEIRTSNLKIPPTTWRPSLPPGLDILGEAAAIVSEADEPGSKPEVNSINEPASTPNKEKPPATPGVDPGSVTSTWSGVYQTPRDGDSILVGVHETPGPIFKAASRTNTPALPGVEESAGKKRFSSLPPQLLPSRRQSSIRHPSMAVAGQGQSATYSQSSGLAAGRLLAFMNPGIVAGAGPSFAADSASNTRGRKGGNDTAGPQPSRLSLRASNAAAGANSTAIAGPSGKSVQVADPRPSTPTQPTTPQAPTPSPLTPPPAPAITITPISLPDANTVTAHDPNGTLARRIQTYQSFDTASDFLERNIHPADKSLIAPPIHDTYVIKTVSTIKCDECSVKLASGGELYQCKTCSAQICRDCVDERLTQEANLKSFKTKVRQDRADAVGGYSMPVEPDDVEEMCEESVKGKGRAAKWAGLSGSVRFQFEWQGKKKHEPFKRCYLDRRQFVGRDQGPFQTDIVVEDYASVNRRVIVRIVQDTPRKGGGGGDGSGSGEAKLKIGKVRKMSEDADAETEDSDVDGGVGIGKKKRKINPKAKAEGKGKGKEKEPQGTEDEPIDLDEWDEDSAQAQVQNAVLGGRPAFDKLRKMQEAARSSRTMGPQPRPVMRGAGHGQGRRRGHQHGHAPETSLPGVPGLYVGFGSVNDDPAQHHQAELQRQYLARQHFAQQQQQQEQQWQQGYGRPFDQAQPGEGYGPTIHGHPDPPRFGNAVAHGQIVGGQAFPQQQYYAGPSTPQGRYQTQPGSPTPAVGQAQSDFMQQDPSYQQSLNSPAEDTANHYPTPEPTNHEARRHVLGNEVSIQTLPPGWIAYIPLPSIFPHPHIHPGVHLGETRDIPFGRGNTFIEQQPLADGTPVSSELPQPYFENALAGLAAIDLQNNMIARAIRRSQRHDRRIQEGRDPDEPMTEAETREELAHRAREDAEDRAARDHAAMRIRWYDRQVNVRRRREAHAAAAQAEVKSQNQAAARGQRGGPAGAGALGQQVMNLQVDARGHHVNVPQHDAVLPAPIHGRLTDPTQVPETIVIDSDEDSDTQIPTNVVRCARKRLRTNTATATPAQPSRKLVPAPTRPQQNTASIDTTNDNTVEGLPVYRGPQPSHPSTEPRNIVRRARIPNQNIAASSAQAQQPATSNNVTSSTPARALPVYRGPQPSHPSIEPQNIVRRARVRENDTAGAQNRELNSVRRAAGSSVGAFVRTRQDYVNLDAEPEPSVRGEPQRQDQTFRAPSGRDLAAFYTITEQDAVVNFEGLPVRYVNQGVTNPFAAAAPAFTQAPAAAAGPTLLPPVNLGPYASRIEMADQHVTTRNRDTVIIDGFDSPVPPSSSPVREDAERLNVLAAAAAVVTDEDETESEEGGREGEGAVEESEEEPRVGLELVPGRLRSGKEFQ